MSITLTSPLNKTVLSGGNITLTWTQSGLSGVTYSVYVWQDSGSFKAAATGLTQLSYTLPNVEAGHSISWYVVAVSSGNIVADVSETWSFYTSLTLTQNGYDLLVSTNEINRCEIASRDDWVDVLGTPSVNTSRLDVGGANIATLSYGTSVTATVPKLANVAMKFFGFGFAVRASAKPTQDTVLANMSFGQGFSAQAKALTDGTIRVVFSYNGNSYQTTLENAKNGAYYYVAISLSKDNNWYLWKYTSNYLHDDHSVSVDKLQGNLLITGSQASLNVNQSYDSFVVYGVQNISVLARGIDPKNRADVLAFHQFGMASETGFTTSASGKTTHYYVQISDLKKRGVTITTGAYGTFSARPPIKYPDTLSFLWGSGIDDEYSSDIGKAPYELNQYVPQLCSNKVLETPSLLGYWDFKKNSTLNALISEDSGLGYFSEQAYNVLSTNYYTATPTGIQVCGAGMPYTSKYSMSYIGHLPYLYNMTIASSFYFFALDTSLLTRSKVVPLTFTNNSVKPLMDYTISTDISYKAGMNPDFSDVVFSDATGKRIPFWLVSYTDSVKATFNIFLKSIPAGGSTTIYMYYDDPYETQSEGDLSGTYPLFSLTGKSTDWLTGSVALPPTTNIYTLSTPTNDNGWIKLQKSADNFFVAHSLSVSQPFTLSFDIKAPDGRWGTMIWQGSQTAPTHSLQVIGDINGSTYGALQLYTDTDKITTNSVNPQLPHHIDLSSDGSNVTLYVDGSVALGPVSYSVTDFQGIALRTWGNSTAPEFNNIALKPYSPVGDITPSVGTERDNVGNLFIDPQQDMVLFDAFGVSINMISPLNTENSPTGVYMLRITFPQYSFITPFSSPPNDTPEVLMQTYKDNKVTVKSIYMRQQDITRMFTVPATWTAQIGQNTVDGHAGVRLYYNGELIMETDITGFTPEAQVYDFVGLNVGANMPCVEFRDYAVFQSNLSPKDIQATQPIVRFLTPIVQGPHGVYTMTGVQAIMQNAGIPYQIYVRHSASEPSQMLTTFTTADGETAVAYDAQSQWEASDWELLPKGQIYPTTDDFVQYKIVSGGQA